MFTYFCPQCNSIPASRLVCIPPLLKVFHDSMVSSPSLHMCSRYSLPETHKLDLYIDVHTPVDNELTPPRHPNATSRMLQRSVQQNWSLTGEGFFRRLKTLVSPRLKEAMVGRGPKDNSLSLCQAMLSFPSRYRLHSNELKVWEISRSIAWRRFRRMGCHYWTEIKKVGQVCVDKWETVFLPMIPTMV